MRHIPLDKLYVPSEWDDYATELVAELRGKSVKERSAMYLKPSYKAWKLLSSLLETLSYGKCFYTEIKIDESWPEIDHYRPKGGIAGKDLKGEVHEGYWWVAFSATNFRYSCKIANLAKVDRFPLAADGVRTSAENNVFDDEKALLLDPANADDVKLINFDEMGKAEPHPQKCQSGSFEYERVQVSIECYALNNEKIKKKRGDLCTKAKTIAEDVLELEEQASLTKTERKQLIQKKIALYEMIQPHAEFSAAVRCTLSGFNNASASIQEILDNTPED
jgi:hypothetical protein